MKILKSITAAALSLLLLSCEGDLNVEPESIVSKQNMWKSSEDATGAMYGMFSQLRAALDDEYIYWGDYRSGFFGDALGSEAANQDLFGNTLDAEDRGTNWQGLYTTINDCNLILKYVPDIAFSDEGNKNFILANAHFARALCYFYIARIWGDAPLVLSGFESDSQEDLYPSRAPASDLFEQAGSDISKALELFPDDGAGSRKTGSKAAANMLKADYYLWMAKTRDGGEAALQQAKTAVDQVLGNSDYALSDNYEEVFRNDDNQEIIYAINFAVNEFEGGFPADYLVAVQYVNDKSLVENPIKVGSHQQWVYFTPEFESFLKETPGDSRAGVSIDSYNEEGNQLFRWINKYLGEWSSGTRFWTSDIKVYRLAEAILFKAEIENALGNQAPALAELNKIARRAYGQDNYYSGSYSQEELDEIILNERLKEFSAEGKSWWDLVRFGDIFERVGSLQGRQGEENVLLWPVNSNSLNSNPNIEQTPGY